MLGFILCPYVGSRDSGITFARPYHSLMKERPPSKECPPSTFGPISCIGSNFNGMSAHPGASFICLTRLLLEKPYQCANRSEFLVPCVPSGQLLQGSLVYLMRWRTVSYNILMVTFTDCAVQSVVLPSSLDFEAANSSIQRRRKDFLIGGAQSETTHRVVSNLYNNL